MKHIGRAVVILGLVAPFGWSGIVEARNPVQKMAVVAPVEDLSMVTASVKFHDGVRARIRAGKLVSLAGRDVHDLAVVLQNYGATLEPVITSVSEADLNRLQVVGLQRTTKAQADLAGMFRVHVPAEHRLLVAQTLNASDLVEQAWLHVDMPPVRFEAWCGDTDYAPTTPDYRDLQGYRDNNDVSGGLGIIGARLVPGVIDPDEDGAPGILGGNVTLGYIDPAGYDILHEDLCYVTPRTGIVPDDHGSAGLGIVLAKESADPNHAGEYGMGGMAPEATGYFWAGQWANGLADAATNLPQGTIVYCTMGSVSPWYGLSDLEDCAFQPCYPFCCSSGENSGCCPTVNMEMTTLDNYLAAQAAVSAGVIVISSAGNNAFNYDGPEFEYHRSWISANGPTGQFMIGAGTPDDRHDRLDFSCFGSQVKLQGWGSEVATLGYGDLVPQAGIGREQFYTTEFGGTSSAAPIVAGAAAALQGLALEVTGAPLTGAEFYSLVTDPLSSPTAPGDGWDTDLDAFGPYQPNVEGAAQLLLGTGTVFTYGACCLGDDFGECIMLPDHEQLNCWSAGGTYRGEGTSCDDAPINGVKVCGLIAEDDRILTPGAEAGDQIGDKITVSDDGSLFVTLSTVDGTVMRATTYEYDTEAQELVWTQNLISADSGFSAKAVDTDLDDTLPLGPERRIAMASGYVQVWTQGPNVWDEEAYLVSEEGFPSANAGTSVALENDVLLLGDPGNGNVQAPAGMQVNVFYRNTLDQWTEGEPILRPEGLSWRSGFGASLAVEGDLLAVGAPFWNDGDTAWDAGAVFFYRRSGDEWTEAGLIADHGELGHAYFGESIDLHVLDDGTARVLISAPGALNDDPRTGAVRLYEVAVDNTVSFVSRFSTPVADSAERFGESIELAADGETIIAGAPRAKDIDGDEVGYVWAWTLVDDDWKEIGRLASRNPSEGDDFGRVVAATADSVANGNMIYVGAPGIQGTNVDTGAVIQYAAAYEDCNNTGVNDILDLVRANDGTVDCSDSDQYDPDYCDCQVNGVPDSCDIANGTSVDLDGNGRPDECDGNARGSMRSADCNFNGIPDHAENLPDSNGNGRADTCDHDCYSQWWCPSDVAGWDGQVDLQDLLAVLSHWGPVHAGDANAFRADFLPEASDGMLEGDGMIDSSELIGVIQAWGGCPDDAIEDLLCFPIDSDGDGQVDSVMAGWYRLP
ncbi:MAG: S8 family serine peptidase [Phycisphaerales bacterium]|nr:S8 family serine peptidase [Phycisphaerales bacterium]